MVQGISARQSALLANGDSMLSKMGEVVGGIAGLLGDEEGNEAIRVQVTMVQEMFQRIADKEVTSEDVEELAIIAEALRDAANEKLKESKGFSGKKNAKAILSNLNDAIKDYRDFAGTAMGSEGLEPKGVLDDVDAMKKTSEKEIAARRTDRMVQKIVGIVGLAVALVAVVTVIALFVIAGFGSFPFAVAVAVWLGDITGMIPLLMLMAAPVLGLFSLDIVVGALKAVGEQEKAVAFFEKEMIKFGQQLKTLKADQEQAIKDLQQLEPLNAEQKKAINDLNEIEKATKAAKVPRAKTEANIVADCNKVQEECLNQIADACRVVDETIKALVVTVSGRPAEDVFG